MNVTVYRALEIPRIPQFPEADFALVPGAPFLVDDDSLTVLEGPLLYLTERFPEMTVLRRNLGGSKHSIIAAARDLAHFVHVAEESVGDWQKIDDQFIIDYCEDLFGMVSSRTQQPLNRHTVFRRASRGLDYCAWRKNKGLSIAVTEYGISFYRKRVRRSGRRARVEMTTDYGRVAKRGTQRRTAIENKRSSVTYLAHPQWALLTEELGPLPSERSAYDGRPSRDRLAAELSVASGMRVDEIAHLTIYQLLDLLVDATMEPADTLELYITWTKGLEPRSVTVPVYLVREIHIYIKTERQSCIEEAKKYWLQEGKKPPPILFLNGVAARRDAGKPVTPGTLSERLHEAVLRCGFYRRIPIVDSNGQEVGVLKVAMFTFHSLRHTYSAWFYEAEKRGGNSSPWEQLQLRLGHADLSTTLDTYLCFDETKRRKVNAVTFSTTREKYSGN